MVGAKYRGGNLEEARDTDEQPLSDKQTVIRRGELTVSGSSNLKALHRVLC